MIKYSQLSRNSMIQSPVDFDETEQEETNWSDKQTSLDVVVYGTDWTIETIISQLEKGNIQLNPKFQRRDAWNCTKKSKFLESLFLGFPIPQIVLAEDTKKRGSYIVLDGKQRLLSLLQFIGKAEGKNNGFSLKGLDILVSELEGKSYHEIKNNLQYIDLITAFNNQTMRSVILKNWKDEKLLYTIFVRLNTGSVQLSPQELRQAMFPGDFSDYVDDVSTKSESLRKLLKINEPDFRMRDVEILVRYLAFKNYINKYNGSMRSFLDDTYKQLNSAWVSISNTIEQQIIDFELAVDAAISIFGLDDVARIPEEAGDRRLFNRAIFDVIIFYFSQAAIRDSALMNSDEVKSAFSQLWKESNDFSNSVGRATNSQSATRNRFKLWGEKLHSVIHIDFSIPEFS